jgi:hypothetical protein
VGAGNETPPSTEDLSTLDVDSLGPAVASQADAAPLEKENSERSGDVVDLEAILARQGFKRSVVNETRG